MPLPNISKDDVERIVPQCKVFREPCKGGQKLVFPCTINDNAYAVKFLLVEQDNMGINMEERTSNNLDEVTARAKREVEVMSVCNSPYLIKLGPTSLQHVVYNNQNILFFTEEWIEGYDLKRKLEIEGPFSYSDTIKLGIDITQAIKELWKHSKIHRDIKPGNIVYDENAGNYILLDMGLAFDLEDKSLTAYGYIPGTKAYFSPEQLSIENKRFIDFRSDLFNLGIVMYECVTGVHPFYVRGMSDRDLFLRILRDVPKRPIEFRIDMIKELDYIVMRLLGKSPHLRYRTCELLIKDLENARITLGV